MEQFLKITILIIGFTLLTFLSLTYLWVTSIITLAIVGFIIKYWFFCIPALVLFSVVLYIINEKIGG